MIWGRGAGYTLLIGIKSNKLMTQITTLLLTWMMFGSGWMGFAQKVKATVLLEKHFIIDKDYKKSLYQPGKQSDHTRGGNNKEIFMLNGGSAPQRRGPRIHRITSYYIV